MAELKEILLGMLVLVYGIMFYIVGRTNMLEKFIMKLNNMLVDYTKTDDDTRTPKERGGEK